MGRFTDRMTRLATDDRTTGPVLERAREAGELIRSLDETGKRQFIRTAVSDLAAAEFFATFPAAALDDMLKIACMEPELLVELHDHLKNAPPGALAPVAREYVEARRAYEEVLGPMLMDLVGTDEILHPDESDEDE